MCLDQPQNATAVGADTNPLPYRQIQRPEPMHLVFLDVFARGSPQARPKRKPSVAGIGSR
jgi:hypothetical protein